MPRHPLLCLLFLVLSVLPLAAQCMGDDGCNLPGACCVPVFPATPSFPAASITTDGASFFNCAVLSTWTNTILLSAPTQIFADLWVANITIVSAQTPTNTALLVMKYARTWWEPTASGGSRQVWRFLVNCDLTYALPGPTPSPAPSCIGAGLPVHFIGSVDYSVNCSTGVWRTLINLTHHCGTYMHGAGSQRPLGSPFDHPDYAYAFVGPAPFTFGLTPPLIGQILGEAQRSTHIDLTTSPITWTTFCEIPVTTGFILPSGSSCPGANTLFPSVPAWTDYNVSFDYVCMAGLPPWTFNPIPLAPLLPTGIAALSLGTYASPPGAFPGPRSVEAWIGLTIAPDPCAGSTFSSLPFHVVSGVSTHGAGIGFPFANPFPTDKFIDLENMQIPTPGAPAGITMGIGSLFVSTSVWNLNMP